MGKGSDYKTLCGNPKTVLRLQEYLEASDPLLKRKIFAFLQKVKNTCSTISDLIVSKPFNHTNTNQALHIWDVVRQDLLNQTEHFCQFSDDINARILGLVRDYLKETNHIIKEHKKASLSASLKSLK